jgi:hypothetical protein
LGSNFEHKTLVTFDLSKTDVTAAESRDTRAFFGDDALGDEVQTYGHGHDRFELGTGIGFLLSHFGGLRLIGATWDEGTGFHLGLEPFNFATDVHTNRDDYIEWLPMLSAGVHWVSNDSNVVLLVRGGGAVGTLATSGARTAWGLGLYANFTRTNVGFDLTRLQTREIPVDMAALDLCWTLSSRIGLGLRGESLIIRERGTSPFPALWSQGGDQREYQALVFVRIGPRPSTGKKGPGTYL